MAGAAAERKVIRILLVEDEEIHRVRPRCAVRVHASCSARELDVSIYTFEFPQRAMQRLFVCWSAGWLPQVLARALLRSACGGVELHEAGTGAEAVRRVRDGGAAAAYDLIITDWKMPVMDGHEVRHAVCVSAKP